MRYSRHLPEYREIQKTVANETTQRNQHTAQTDAIQEARIKTTKHVDTKLKRS